MKPWFVRGGDHNDGLDSGVFAFGNHYGSVLAWLGFRVLTMLEKEKDKTKVFYISK